MPFIPIINESVADIYASEELFLTMETKTKDKKNYFQKIQSPGTSIALS